MKMSETGIIIKGIAGFYYVKSGDALYRCKARGIFKEQGVRLATGDRVTVEVAEEGSDSLITELHPRKNSFIRPFVTNVDCFVVVTAVRKPAPVPRITDRFLVMAEQAGTDIVLCINKCDLADPEKLAEIYSPIYPVVCTDGVSGRGIDRLMELIRGKVTALAGPSGVGKSTIINRLVPGAAMETGEISSKSGRGRHTTRHSEIFDLEDGLGTMIFDTPGFTSFTGENIPEEELQRYYPEIFEHSQGCRYDNCRHIAEPGCAVKEALSCGDISESRYESYRSHMEEIRK
ncbi:MAG: ribosome small subunit-dependent GTPase A [Clostridiales bacterium]|nr:ribosome small subunit-dependent GTPase A [Clostridiales bacterium]MDD7036151.1 ribosome small subunit-dependent GTPase A [Bacillota bacterium]MDY2921189.1 ribosome small subunit-dependent GTPase A [Lentihominibacter sp.]